MAVFLDRVDAVALAHDEFSFEFNSWVANLIDSLNETISTVENNLNGIRNGLIAPSKTVAQITTLATDAVDGTVWYASDHIPPVFVGKVNGSLVQFTTAAFP